MILRNPTMFIFMDRPRILPDYSNQLNHSMRGSLKKYIVKFGYSRGRMLEAGTLSWRIEPTRWNVTIGLSNRNVGQDHSARITTIRFFIFPIGDLGPTKQTKNEFIEFRFRRIMTFRTSIENDTRINMITAKGRLNICMTSRSILSI